MNLLCPICNNQLTEYYDGYYCDDEVSEYHHFDILIDNKNNIIGYTSSLINEQWMEADKLQNFTRIVDVNYVPIVAVNLYFTIELNKPFLTQIDVIHDKLYKYIPFS